MVFVCNHQKNKWEKQEEKQLREAKKQGHRRQNVWTNKQKNN